MADLDSFGDLFEESLRLALPQPFSAPHVRVEVAVRLREHQVQVAVPDEDLVEGRDPRMAVEFVVCGNE